MAQRRMFSKAIVGSEEFTVMPKSSQALYFHLGMEADDDGFIHPGKIMRGGGYQEDDLKILLAKRFLLTFESGVVVIKHWLIHNLIQKDRYTNTRYQDEIGTLFIKENKAYTDNLPIKVCSVNKVLPQVRLGKVNIREEKKENSLSYLENLKEEDLKELNIKFKCENSEIKTKANALIDYCKSKGRIYKNYKALLSNALRKDFGERPTKTKTPQYEIVEGVAKIIGYK